MMVRTMALILAAMVVAPAEAAPRTICRNTVGTAGGVFHSFYLTGGTGCMTIRDRGRSVLEWRLSPSGNVVAGRGWGTGSPSRTVGYRARAFVAGANGYLALYGWSVDPLVEYYVVENWGAFVPPGEGAVALGTVAADGGTYRIYRTRRIGQPSIAGTADFDQYWSVRTTKRPLGGVNRISFATHVAAWRRAGMALGTMRYQILATEGFGSTGRSDVQVWRQ